MSNIKAINENSLNSKCKTMSDLSNKTNEKEYLFCPDNDNKKIKRFTKMKRNKENSYSRKCCYCKRIVSIDSIEFKNKEDLVNKIDKSKEIINKNEIKFKRFKKNQIICKSCLDEILKKEDGKNIIKQIFFIKKKRGKTKSKIRKKDKQNNINNANLEEIDDKSHISSINNELKQNSLMSIDIDEYENCLSYIKQYLISVFRIVIIFGENYNQFLLNMSNKYYTFFQSYIQTKNILQIMFNTGKIITLNFKNITDNTIKNLNLIKANYCSNEVSKNKIQELLHLLVIKTNEILFKLANFFNNLNVLISFLNGKGAN
jgi:hypothetical protein